METLRVLVTDDEPGMRLGVARALRDYRVWIPDTDTEVAFEVEQAESGEEALEKIKRRAPDILLLDHKMPGISGLDVLDRVAGMKLDMLTIMITAYASIETAITATKRGAWEFLAKPFTPDDLRDTLRKTAARVLLARRARLLANEKRQVRFEFVRVLGHELKAPLAAVSSFLEVMRGRHLGDSIADYDEVLARCEARLAGMRRLVGDLLDLTRIESGQKLRRLETLDGGAIARGVIETLQPLAAGREVTVAMAPNGEVPMLADAGEIEMVVTNLVSNAIKYNRKGGRVDVSFGRDGDRATLRVADTGIGMTPEQVEHMFDEFMRGPRVAGVEGTGLGLSIVRKLVQLYDGTIDVASEPDRGTTVSVSLAVGAAEEAAKGAT